MSAQELKDLTDRTYPKYQIAWLVANDWKFEVGAGGHPKVLTAYANERMGVKSARRRGPNLEGLARRVSA